MTALALALWIGAWEAVHSGILVDRLGGFSIETLATAFSPLRAVLAAARPRAHDTLAQLLAINDVSLYVLVSLGIAALINLWSIVRVRIWNPSREVRPLQQEEAWQGSIWGDEHDMKAMTGGSAADAGSADAGSAVPVNASAAALEDRRTIVTDDRAKHIDSYRWKAPRASREVWNNPVLWREVRTRAYGRKLIVIQLAYFAMWLMVGVGLSWLMQDANRPVDGGSVIPIAAQPLAPFFLVSLVVINALAVNSITNERDGHALDLILVSDISPVEFVFGKLGGVLWVTKLMVLGPLLLAGYLWWAGGIELENLIYLLVGLVVMNILITPVRGRRSESAWGPCSFCSSASSPA
jgi:hypothetical protein